MALLKDLSMLELATQWHVFQSKIEKLEQRLNRMYSDKNTKKDCLDIISGRGDELKLDLNDALHLQESVEYWLRQRGTTQDQIEKWNIKPRFERFDNYNKT